MTPVSRAGPHAGTPARPMGRSGDDAHGHGDDDHQRGTTRDGVTCPNSNGMFPVENERRDVTQLKPWSAIGDHPASDHRTGQQHQPGDTGEPDQAREQSDHTSMKAAAPNDTTRALLQHGGSVVGLGRRRLHGSIEPVVGRRLDHRCFLLTVSEPTSSAPLPAPERAPGCFARRARYRHVRARRPARKRASSARVGVRAGGRAHPCRIQDGSEGRRLASICVPSIRR